MNHLYVIHEYTKGMRMGPSHCPCFLVDDVQTSVLPHADESIVAESVVKIERPHAVIAHECSCQETVCPLELGVELHSLLIDFDR